MPHSTPSVSVVCTVRNDVDGLRTMLDSLARQTLPPDEIVIADGGTDREQLDQLRDVVHQNPRARLILGARCTIADGRNRAIRAARHDLIACIDAGCVAEPNWLERLIAPFRDARVEVVGGSYSVTGESNFEKLVGLITMPGALRPVDPLRFNPSARSIAFRRGAWERALGFPHWLQTAEDTLFDLRLRSLTPAPAYAFAADAVVHWRPRTTLRAVFRQFHAYERGEAHIGRGGATHGYHTKRYAALIGWTLVAFGWTALYGPALGMLAATIATLLLLSPHHRTAHQAARSPDTKSGDNSPPARYAACIALSEWITIARWLGHRRGHRERRREPVTYVTNLRNYLGSDSADIEVPPWNMRATPAPRTLIVAWHWPPASRASANVLASLFASATPRGFQVITRATGHVPEDARTPEPELPTVRLPWPLAGDRPMRFKTIFADLLTTARMVFAADRIDAEWPVQRVLAVYPYRWGFVAGWLIARRLGVPFVPYMHDLCSEGLLTKSTVRRTAWRLFDGAALRAAWMVVVPTREFAAHYAKRGVSRTFVLPHCTAPDSPARSGLAAGESGPLRLVYAGNVYEAHEDAVAALVAATRDFSAASLTFHSNAHPLLAGQDVRWVSRKEAMAALSQADATVVALGFRTPFPEEVQGCFPSKIVDYLAAGRPILAVVPGGCFVDRFIRETRCGVVVNSAECSAIREGIAALQDPLARRSMATAAREAALRLDPEHWLGELRRRLALGPCPPAPPVATAQPEPTAPSPPAALTRPAPEAHFDVSTI